MPIAFSTPSDLNLRPLRELQEIPTGTVIDADYTQFSSGGPIKYRIVEGTLPETIFLDEDSGVITGYVQEMDDWVPEYVNAIPEYTNQNYATAGSAGLFYAVTGETGSTLTNTAIGYRATFTVEAYDSLAANLNSTNSVQREFYFRLFNNWSSDRDRFLREYDVQFFIDGEPVDNVDYVLRQKEAGYFD